MQSLCEVGLDDPSDLGGICVITLISVGHMQEASPKLIWVILPNLGGILHM